ncbi:hypothetical protein MTO96_035229 [Rhipicephalus appendiculatus]
MRVRGSDDRVRGPRLSQCTRRQRGVAVNYGSFVYRKTGSMAQDRQETRERKERWRPRGSRQPAFVVEPVAPGGATYGSGVCPQDLPHDQRPKTAKQQPGIHQLGPSTTYQPQISAASNGSPLSPGLS